MKRSLQKIMLQPPIGEELFIWPGKEKLQYIEEAGAQLVSEYGAAHQKVNHLFYGNNIDVLRHLLTSYKEKVQLIYIDPPFESQTNYDKKIALKGMKHVKPIFETQYVDRWGKYDYLQFLYERLQLLYTLLAPNGSIYVHCDWRKSHHIRLMLDEIFGADQFRNEIIWKRGTVKGAKAKGKQFARNHDTIFYYTKTNDYTFNRQYTPFNERYLQRFNKDDADGRGPYRDDQAVGTRSEQAIAEMMANGRIFEYEGKLRIKTYLNDLPGIVMDDNWADISEVNVRSKVRTMYPTQKPEELLERIINTSSNEGDMVLDCFSGSGTTAAVAAKLGRQFIGVDNNIGAIQTAIMRLVNQDASFSVHTVECKWPVCDIKAHIVWNEHVQSLEIKHWDTNYLTQKLGGTEFTHWKQLIDHVQIDWQYDGLIFRPSEFDIGSVEKCIEGIYSIPHNSGEVAMQITDVFSNQFFIQVNH